MIAAFLYDFDKTLCTKDMQEYTFLPKLGISPEMFWKEAGSLAKNQGMDSILAYLYLMISRSKAAQKPVRREDFVAMGKGVKFFPGVKGWFSRINAYGKKKGITVEHYIISSGLKEIIEGSGIPQEFKKIYACEFHYDENGVADWPLLAVNYTGKTQFLFRINKGVLELSEDKALNTYVAEGERRIPFSHMVYFGDGLTDVPCMKLVKSNGGKSIAVWEKSQEIAKTLVRDQRVDFVEKADYRAGSSLDKTACAILDYLSAREVLSQKSRKEKAGGKKK